MIKLNKFKRIIAFYLALTLLFDVCYPTAAFALTSGPSQPEMQGFTPIGTSDMVDAFSGDFKYNIPLLDVGGYPINLSYAAGSGMDAEASWVGLGWSLNPGVISRNMRGVPDDFNGDNIQKDYNIKNNLTFGVTFGGMYKLANIPGLGIGYSLGLNYNNYNGVAFNMSVNPSITVGDPNKSSGTFGLGLSAGSESGVGIQPEVSFTMTDKRAEKSDIQTTGSIGLGFNSRTGLSSLTISGGVSQGEINEHAKNNAKDPNVKKFEADPKKAHFNGGSSISFSNPTFAPPTGKNFISIGVTVTASFGADAILNYPAFQIGGSFSGQFLADNHQDNQSYGYMYLDASGNDKDAMLDFNREKDGPITPSTPNLPLGYLTYDIFSVSGQGIGGMYRPFRSDAGVVYDKFANNLSGGLDVNLGLEFGVGDLAHDGVNLAVSVNVTENGKWQNDNTALNYLAFNGSGANESYEPYYFKQAGEKTSESDMDFFRGLGGFNPAYVALNKNISANVTAKSSFVNANGSSWQMTTAGTKRSHRARRNEGINALTANEATVGAYVSQIEQYPVNSTPSDFQFGTSGTYKNRFQPSSLVSRTSGYYSPQHISEITSYRSDGARYVYGIPAYNTNQVEVSFNASDALGPIPIPNAANSKVNPTTGQISYVPNVDNSKDNSNGIDNFYSKTTTPAYAHSYLLTEVLSADYVDITGDGPTDDDLGTYTKINYRQAYNNYNWRTPFQGNMANASLGLFSDPSDDKGNYVAGTKEIYFIHSIETKNFVAEFYTSKRSDSYGVLGENGGIDPSKASYKLDKIELYSKQDKIKNGTNALPIKTVNFVYDYSLCAGYDATHLSPDNYYQSNSGDPANGHGGKLTLKQVYFTYQKSNKGKLSPYNFTYCDYNHDGTPDQDLNPSYNMKAYDRWGTYKPVPAGADFSFAFTSGGLNPHSLAVNNADFPYTDQGGSGITSPQATLADQYAWSWNLTNIQLPSGGQINVDYEADDYAYVQDNKAMQMCKVTGITIGTTPPTSLAGGNQLFTLPFQSDQFLTVQIDEQLDPSLTNADFRRKFLEDENGNFIQFMYFKFLMNIGFDLVGLPNYEYVPGYVRISDSDYGFIRDGGGNIVGGYVKLKSVQIQDKISTSIEQVNPISQAGWNYARINRPRVAYKQSDPGTNAIVQVFEALASTALSIISLETGMNNSMQLTFSSCFVVLNKSFIRLYHPTQIKKGGGYRIKQLALVDKWKELTNPVVSGTNKYTDAQYGQQYTYTTTDQHGNTISSGVAAYEPGIGNDENPLHQPIFSEEKHLLVANEQYYQEKPYGESFYPGASIGYSKVTVKNLQYTGSPKVTRNATGYNVQEFYTAKDFPVFVNIAGMDPYRHKPNPLFKILKIVSNDYYTASEGYAIELNDMHGKPKANWVYQEGQTTAISGTEYEYFQQASNHLDNNVWVINKNGNINKEQVGVDFDVTTDMRQSDNETISASTSFNVEVAIFGIIPLPFPLVLPSFGHEKVRSRFAVMTKVINRYGILKKTTTHDLGSKVESYNQLFDAETGEVVSTQTTNQFNDMVYSFNYPAHWGYDLMGNSYKNLGLGILSTSSNVNQFLVPGDELLVYPFSGFSLGTPSKGWVINNSPLQIMQRNGSYVNLSSPYYLKVIRSGRRNMQQTSIGSITSKNMPWSQLTDSTGQLSINQSTNIIDAHAIQFTDQTKIFCECNITDGQPYNPYVVGLNGNYRQQKAYTYLTSRTQSKLNENLNVRKDGIFANFNSFWSPSGGSVYSPLSWGTNTTNWTFVNQVTIFSPYGVELENKDAIGRYSSADFGYNYSLPKAVAANAQYRETGFDGFEDYDFSNCGTPHFSFPNYAANVVTTQSHSGRRSIQVAPTSTVSVKKYIQDCSNCSNFNVAVAIHSGVATATPSGGTAPYSYYWTLTYGGQTTTSVGSTYTVPTIATGVPYTVVVTATDAQNCTKTITQSGVGN